MSTTTIGPWKVGEIPAPIVVTFKDSTGAALNLTGYTAKWITQLEETASVSHDMTAFSDGSDGKFQYQWVDGDFDIAGNYTAEAWAGNSDNRFATVTYSYAVEEAVADSTPSI